MYRIITSIISCFLIATSIHAQRATCAPDTLKFTFEKASQIDTLTLIPNQNSGAFQYYECPQEITISGARFYGWKPDTTGGVTVDVTVEIVRATQDSIPGTVVLASGTATLSIPDSLDGPMESYAVDVTWTPVDVDDDYTVVVRTDPANGPFVVLHNHLDGTSSDGDEEWLSGVKQGLSWIKSYDFLYNSVDPFDADFFFEPFVQYNINASFVNDPECLFDELGETVEFFNDGAPIVDSRMYNRYAFYNIGDRQRWVFGDGVVADLANPIHFYPTNGPYVATMTAKIITWTNQFCQSPVTQIIKEKPKQDFSFKKSNLSVNFTNETFGLFSSIHYDFGDGNSSSSENPNHKYFEPGTYWVCQTMETSCGEIKQCKNVAVATDTALNCGMDSVRYTAARGTDTRVRELRLSNPGRLYGIGQIFDVNQPMIIHGFSFYANHQGLFKDSYPVKCRIYDKGGNKLPDGDPLAESVVHINKIIVDTLYNDSTRYTAIFNRPVGVTNDYILTIEFDTIEYPVPLQIAVTDWDENDGQGDLLAIGKYNDSTWVTAASVSTFNCQGTACDMDVLIEPLIEFNLDANFEYGFYCMDFDNQPVEFEQLSSEIVKSKIYNKIAFNSSFVQAYAWDFGDGSPIANSPAPSHTFVGDGPFDVKLTVTVEGWTKDPCVSLQEHNIPVDPTGGFSYEQVTSQVNFIDSSKNADAYLWTFSDNTVSTLANPIHYFTEIGKFEVCQYVSNVCGSDTICDSITINVVGIPESVMESIHIYPNPANDNINIDFNDDNLNNLTIELFDISGRMVKRETLTSAIGNRNLFVGDLSEGTYSLKIKANEYEGSKLIVIQR